VERDENLLHCKASRSLSTPEIGRLARADDQSSASVETVHSRRKDRPTAPPQRAAAVVRLTVRRSRSLLPSARRPARTVDCAGPAGFDGHGSAEHRTITGSVCFTAPADFRPTYLIISRAMPDDTAVHIAAIGR
jgi:hypothetical protein